MKKVIFSFIFIFLFSVNISAVFAESSRDQIISNELDCVSSHFDQEQTVSWQDVCYTAPTSESSKQSNRQYNDWNENWDDSQPTGPSKFGFEIAPETSFIRYEEPNFMEEEGMMYGVGGAVTYRISENKHIHSLGDVFSDENKINVFRVEGRYSYGKVDYTSNGTGSTEDIEDFIFEIRGLAGYDIPVGNTNKITPYSGIAYRYLNDDSGGRQTTTGHYGYERESNYVYVPIGFKTSHNLPSHWILNLFAEYDWFTGGKQQSHLDDVDSSLNTVVNNQNEGYGLRGSIRLARQFEDGYQLSVEPFIRYWNIKASDVALITCGGTPCAAGYEPNNNSTEYGLKLTASF